MKGEIVNKVEQSGIITIDLETLVPNMEMSSIDIKDQLFHGLILKEKDFRGWVKETDWSIYTDKAVAVHCSADAVVPTWAYMLISTALNGITNYVFFVTPDQLGAMLAERALNSVVPSDYQDKRVVIKGCGEREISNHAYVTLSTKLAPVVKSLMFGEPCSTVPVYKKRK
ncbi:MAG: DUF2480 family protein [Bacteroidia bacterium]